jgi:hypothetical protein
MAKIRTAIVHAVRSTPRASRLACAREPRKQGICSMGVHENLFALTEACDMLRAESLAAKSFFSRHFFQRGVE